MLGCVLFRAADWPTQSGSPQREGWAKSERVLSKTNVADLKVLYQVRPEGNSASILSAPIINGNLITYKGFKEMLVFSANSSRVYSVDADLNKPIWESRFNVPISAKNPCSTDSSAPVIMAGSSSATLHFAPPPGTAPAGGMNVRRRHSPYEPPLSQSLYPLLPTTLTRLNAMYTVTADGALHVVNSSTGEDLLPAMPFVPAGTRVRSLNLHENTVYASTSEGCDSGKTTLYALDLLSNDKHVASYTAPGLGETSLAADGTLFVQAASSPDDKPGHYHQSLIALHPKDLRVKAYFTPQAKELKKSAMLPGTTPLPFSWQGKSMVIAGFADGHLYLLDGNSPGGADHHTSVLQTGTLMNGAEKKSGVSFHGAFASWPDVDGGKRWFYIPVSTPSGGNIVAFRLGIVADGQLQMEQVWMSGNLISPAAPVVANGMLFALSTGNPSPASKVRRKHLPASRPAVLYALDAVTGSELYSSRDSLAGPARTSGIAVANGRIYFSAANNRIYCFGLPKTQPQLAEH